ncbi:MAG: IscS subfamily cysteine desulfurase [Actinobacteria bacterium]|nr:IscS subfamily cysteine desulfurase [Actinomycetota bacterium]MBL7060461.1 IscS subfamily cysteine desulfurase [Actinomycetota bacterium]
MNSKIKKDGRKRIFFDNASTTRIDDHVFKEMEPYFRENYGNPSSLHDFGESAKIVVEQARKKVADMIGASAEEIYFTSCGTESNNLALWGLARALKGKGSHIISSVIEHHSIINPLKEMKKNGWNISLVPVDKYGLVNLGDIENEITGSTTVLISVMHANNEIGTIQKLREISQIAKKHNIVFHSDGMATAGIIPVNVKELGIDAYSFSAQQLHGPKGVAALFIKRGTRIKPIFLGGIQEKGRRAGTENVPGIVGFGEACELAKIRMNENMKYVSKLRDSLIKRLEDKITDIKLNGHPTRRLPGNVHISFEYIEGESILLMLNMEGIAAASGSSCASQALKSSHVLNAIGLSPTMAQGSILFSLGKYNTDLEINRLLEVLPPIVKRLREMSPIYRK